MNRRDFLRASAVGAGVARLLPAREQQPSQVMTVAGPIAATALGVTLPHEHLVSDSLSAREGGRERHHPQEVFDAILPQLKLLAKLGCRTLVDCTPAYHGRDAALLKRLSTASGLHLLTNTGYYGSVEDKFLPDHAFRETADQLAARWLEEWRGGIEETGIRPGLIKIAVDRGSLSLVDRKLVQAAARTHRESGLTIASHTDDGTAAQEQLATLEDEGVYPSAWIWVHAQNEPDPTRYVRAAERGAWIEFDDMGPGTINRHVGLVSDMKRRGLLGRVLVSHDAVAYRSDRRRNPFEALLTRFVPALRVAGFTDGEIRKLIVDNPRDALTLRVRRNRVG